MESSQSYELAGISDRFIALVIDTLIIWLAAGLFGTQAGLWGGGLIGFLIGAVYQWYFLTQQNGQTLGKKVMNIRVIKVDGAKLTDADAVLRYIGYMVNTIPFLIGLPWLWAIFDAKNQGLQDKIANTYVIKVGKSVNGDVVFMDEKRKNSF